MVFWKGKDEHGRKGGHLEQTRNIATKELKRYSHARQIHKALFICFDQL
jgi:hypothetical protein